MPQFSDMLKYFRKRSNLTQQELAEKVGLSRSRINNYEQGIRQPDFETAELFADFFNVDMDTLLARDPADVFPLTWDQQDLLNCYAQLNDEGKDDLRKQARVMVSSGMYREYPVDDLVKNA